MIEDAESEMRSEVDALYVQKTRAVVEETRKKRRGGGPTQGMEHTQADGDDDDDDDRGDPRRPGALTPSKRAVLLEAKSRIERGAGDLPEGFAEAHAEAVARARGALLGGEGGDAGGVR